jgi:hypothetical protein
MYLDLFIDCSSNNNYSVNSHMEFPLYTYLYSDDKETIVKQSNYEFSNNLSQDCDSVSNLFMDNIEYSHAYSFSSSDVLNFDLFVTWKKNKLFTMTPWILMTLRHFTLW